MERPIWLPAPPAPFSREVGKPPKPSGRSPEYSRSSRWLKPGTSAPNYSGKRCPGPSLGPGSAAVLAGAVLIFLGLRRNAHQKVTTGSHVLIAGLLLTSAAARFPVILHTTLSGDSLTIYNSAADPRSLFLALIWWPFAFALTWAYVLLLSRAYRSASAPPKITQQPAPGP